MKIHADHYECLKEAIETALHSFPHTLDEYLAAGNSAKRYRWDVLWHAKQTDFVCNTLYRYLNDDHIDTAAQENF